MKKTLFFGLFTPVAALAASLTGDGYISVTKPATAWTPPSNVHSTNRFLWYPDAAALRFGDLSSGAQSYWNPSSIGTYSFAGGIDSRASGRASFAFGDGAYASGEQAISMGPYTQASAWSVAIGSDSVALGGLAIGGGYASGGYAIMGYATNGGLAIGMSSSATAPYSFALSTIDMASASADGAFAIGNMATASGAYSIAFGSEAIANADGAAAFGNLSFTNSQNSVAIGTGNVSNRMNGTAASPSSPQADDPVFMVGKGPLDPWSVPQTRNAITVYRNGTTHFDGIVRLKPAGDIPMGGYTAKPSGVQYP